MTAALREKTVFRTGRLLNERRWILSGSTATLIHPAYERFLDIKRLAKNRKARRIHNSFLEVCVSRLSNNCEHALCQAGPLRYRIFNHTTNETPQINARFFVLFHKDIVKKYGERHHS